MYNFMMNNWQYYGRFDRWGGGPFDMAWGGGPIFMLGVGLLAIWSIVWKGMALWKASHQESKVWFIVLLVVNTLGILEILYIYYFSVKPDNWLHRLARKIHS